MKKFRYIAVASLAAAITVVSCSKEEMKSSASSENTILKASIRKAPDTKTGMSGATQGSTNVSVVWTEGDKISVLSGNSYSKNTEFTLDAECKGLTYGSFSGASVSGNVIAVYPYASNIKFENNKVKLTIPKTQAYNDSSFAQNSVPMVAKGTIPDTLKFNYLFSAIAFKVTAPSKSVTKVSVVATTPLWGPAEITNLDTTPTITMTGTDNKYFGVDLTCDAPQDISSAKVFYIAVPAGTYTFAVNVYCGTEVFHTLYSTAKTFTTGTVKYNESAKSLSSANGPAYVDGSYIGSGSRYNGIYWAPVNCGYDATDYKYGRLYQWGRKYGQGYKDDTYSDGDYIGKSGGEQTLETISSALSTYPDGETYNGKFYKIKNHWYDGSSPARGNLWGKPKTEYDPCPVGWRVPTRDEWGNMLYSDWNGSSGSTLNSHSWDASNNIGTINGLSLPAAGMFSSNTGASAYRGSQCEYSTSTPPSSTASNAYLVCYTSTEEPSILALAQSMGLSVRCVQE